MLIYRVRNFIGDQSERDILEKCRRMEDMITRVTMGTSLQQSLVSGLVMTNLSLTV